MLKYVDFWYVLKTTKHAQTILRGVSIETTKALAVLRYKIISMLQDSSADWRFSYLSLFVARSIFNLSETIFPAHENTKKRFDLVLRALKIRHFILEILILWHTIYRRFGTKSFRHLDDSALDVSAPRRFGTNLKKSLDDSAPRRFGTKAFQY